MFSPIRPSSKLVEYLLVATLGLIGLTGLYAATVYFSHQSDKQTLAMEHPFQAGLEEIAQIELMPEDLKTAGLPPVECPTRGQGLGDLNGSAAAVLVDTQRSVGRRASVFSD